MDLEKNILIILLLLIATPCFISAQYDWAMYGGESVLLSQSQLGGAYGRFDTGINNVSIAEGYNSGGSNTVSYQPLSVHFNLSTNFSEYLVLQNLNYLQIYDNSLNLMQEISTGTNAISQIDTMFWDDNLDRDIAGIYRYNSTLLQFRVYTYNTTSNSLKLIFQQNFTTSTTQDKVAGVRHQGNTAFFILPLSVSGSNYSQEFIKINSSGVQTTTILDNQSCFYTEPLGWVDADNDGNIEYLTYCSSPSSISKGSVILFQENGLIDFNYSSSAHVYPDTSLGRFIDAKFVRVDGTGTYKLAILEGEEYTLSGSSVGHTTSTISVKRVDGSTLWTHTYTGLYTDSNAGGYGKLSVIADYNGDGFNDIAMALGGDLYDWQHTPFIVAQNRLRFVIFDGDSGTSLKNYQSGVLGYNGDGGVLSLVTSDLNSDGKPEFLVSFLNGITIRDMENGVSLVQLNPNNSSGFSLSSCISADLNFDGFQEAICSGQDKTYEFYSNTTNQNAQIDSVAFNPSITFSNGTTMTATVSASDTEGNTPLHYIYKCDSTENWSSETVSNVYNCTYNVIGNYTFSAGVRDEYHFIYNNFSQTIYVTETGGFCGDSICSGGETNGNCPADCPITEGGGGVIMNIPLQIVDTNNTEQGLLPEIYYGTLGFLSNTLSPMIIFIFLIFLVLIMLTVGTLIKNIASKVGR